MVNDWIEGVLKNRGVDAELTLGYCRQIEKYAKEKDNKTLLGFAYYYCGETHYGLNDGENLFKYITRAIGYLDETGQWELLARSYNLMAITAANRGNVAVAMDYYLTGLNYCKKCGIPDIQNMIHLNLGTLYLNNGQYKEAQPYFKKGYEYTSAHKEAEDYRTRLTCIYIGIGRCCLLAGKNEEAGNYCNLLDEECVPYLDNIEMLCVLCFKAYYYHRMERVAARDACIEEINNRVNEDFVVMDNFDDLYDVCRLLLEIKRDDVLWKILTILEDLTKRARIVNLQRKIISLKIKYYRSIGENAGFLQAAGLHYELTEIMERENRYMMVSIMNIRNSLERANEQRRMVEEANERLVRKSETDQLTGLPNRYRLNEYSEKVFERCRKSGISLAMEILDIDYFKQYNDNYGHQAGDKCIAAIADELKRMQNEHIFCARYGGDEFIVIYEDMPKDKVRQAAEKLRQNIMDLQIEHRYSMALPVVTITQGICFDIPTADSKSWDYLHTADAMLYRVKKQCRNNICMGNLNSENIWMSETVTQSEDANTI